MRDLVRLRGAQSPRLRPDINRAITTTITGACEMTGLGRSKIYELIAERQLRSTTVGARRLVFVDSIVALLNGGAE